jgi:hypothetical protein
MGSQAEGKSRSNTGKSEKNQHLKAVARLGKQLI